MRTKTAVLAAASTVLTAISAIALASDPAVITGTWLLEDGSVAIEIAACDGGLCGTVVWLNEEGAVGDLVLAKLPGEPNGKGAYKGGEFQHPVNGRTYYKCELRLQDDGKLRLQGQAGIMKDGRVATSRFPTTFRFTRTEIEALTSR